MKQQQQADDDDRDFMDFWEALSCWTVQERARRGLTWEKTLLALQATIVDVLECCDPETQSRMRETILQSLPYFIEGRLQVTR